jgi:hypothetical protein
MLTQTFQTLEQCYDRDVFETIDDAIELKVLHFEQGARLNYEKGRGMAWINEEPEVPMCPICGNESKEQPCFKCL